MLKNEFLIIIKRYVKSIMKEEINSDVLNTLIKKNVNNISNDQLYGLTDDIHEIISKKIFEYKYKNSRLEKINYELLLENIKLKNKEIPNKIQFLPNEVFESIMNYLDLGTILECRLLCKYWHDKVSYISHRYIKIKNKEYSKYNIDDINDFLKIWKKFVNKKIPCERIMFYDNCKVYDDFFMYLIENENFSGNLFYIDVNYKKGLYTYGNYDSRKINIFGNIEIVYEYIEYFKPCHIVISRAYINDVIFKHIIMYCINQNRDIDIILDNCCTILVILI